MKQDLLVLCALPMALLSLTGCGRKSEPGPETEPAPDTRALINEDIAQLPKLSARGVASFDANSDHAYSKLFGGLTGADAQRFLEERVKHYADRATVEGQLDHYHFRFKAWAQELEFGPEEKQKDSEVKVGAINYGTLVWLLSAINELPITLTLEGESVPVESTRVGLIVTGPGYQRTEKNRSGKVFTLPVEYRQSILIHEARHSDCTGGLSAKAIAEARGAKSADDFQSLTCGHLHVTCPAGHDYAGFAACDRESWGAYTVGAVFSEAMIENYAEASAEWQILKLWTADQKGRSLVDEPRAGTPDLTSSGKVD